MEIFAHIIEVDFFVLVTALFLLIFLRANEAYDHELNIHIKRTLILLAALAFCDTMDAILGAEAERHFLRAFFVGGGYILRPLLLMSAVMLFRQYQFDKKERIQLIIPGAVSALIILTAFFNPLVFTIDEANVLHRGFLSYVPLAACLYYIIYAARMTVQQKQRGFEEESRIMTLSLVAIALGIVIEVIFQVRGALCGAVVLLLAFYYLYRHMDSSRRDTLTGAFNRASFFADLSKMRPEQMTAFCEFDMNNLKEINDIQGHMEGDKAIIAMYTLIQKCLPVQSHLYRFGGDEFAVLFFDVNMSTVFGTVYRIREEFEKSQYGCAIGVAEWKENMTFREVYNAADEQMYEDKKRQKEKAGKLPHHVPVSEEERQAEKEA